MLSHEGQAAERQEWVNYLHCLIHAGLHQQQDPPRQQQVRPDHRRKLFYFSVSLIWMRQEAEQALPAPTRGSRSLWGRGDQRPSQTNPAQGSSAWSSRGGGGRQLRSDWLPRLPPPRGAGRGEACRRRLRLKVCPRGQHPSLRASPGARAEQRGAAIAGRDRAR